MASSADRVAIRRFDFRAGSKWDSENEEVLRRLSNHTDRIRTLLFFIDGELVALGAHEELVGDEATLMPARIYVTFVGIASPYRGARIGLPIERRLSHYVLEAVLYDASETRGHRLAVAEIHTDNAASQRLFAAFGFHQLRPIGPRHHEYIGSIGVAPAQAPPP